MEVSRFVREPFRAGVSVRELCARQATRLTWDSWNTSYSRTWYTLRSELGLYGARS